MLSGDTTAGEMKLKDTVRTRSNIASTSTHRMKMKAPKAVISEPGQISCLQGGQPVLKSVRIWDIHSSADMNTDLSKHPVEIACD